MRIIVHVKPNSREFRVEKISDKERIVYVRSPPKKGLANKELVKELKRLLKRNVTIVSGFTSRTKVIEIRDRMIYELSLRVESEVSLEAIGRIRVLLFTLPVIDVAKDLLYCSDNACDYRFTISGYRSEAAIEFEVHTENIYVGLKEPEIQGGFDSRTYSSELIRLSEDLPKDYKEYIEEAVKLARKSIRYVELQKRIGVHEAMRLGIGDCEEYTDILSALLRARGFVVRRIVGVVPGGLHARLEYKAKDGSRVPIDPTRNEIGRISKYHVPIFVGHKRPIRIPKKTRITSLQVRLRADETVPV